MYFELEGAPYHCLDVEISKPTARGGQTLRPKPFPNEQNYAERFLDDPVLKIEHAQSGKDKKTEKREQLIAPFHQAM